jgi:hypothetical protein
MGRPTNEGKMAVGKFAPAKPHFTNYQEKKEKNSKRISDLLTLGIG